MNPNPTPLPSCARLHPLALPGLVAFWDFQEEAGQDIISKGAHGYRLYERDGSVPRVADGLFGPQAIQLGCGPWLCSPRAECQALNFCGARAKFTMVAWIKRLHAGNTGCQAVAGMWNEHGLRQYCLFLNLQIHDSAEQVAAHVSSHGGASPGEKYCMEAAIGATPVPFDVWQCAAISYDGTQAYAWLNGKLDVHGNRNPFAYPHGIFDAGPDGADFTVGAVQRPAWVDEDLKPHGAVTANLYHGRLGGLAVFDRDLTAKEIRALSGIG